MNESATLDTILWNDVISSILVQFMDLEAKRNLRLVCHAGKDAVDKTVTAVVAETEGYNMHNYLYILAKSNWAGIKKILYRNGHPNPRILEGPAFIPEGFEAIMEQAPWSHLEWLSINALPDDIAAIISASDWPLIFLIVTGGFYPMSPKSIALLMQASWVATIEVLFLNGIKIGEMGARAVAEASYRAVNLKILSLCYCYMEDEEARLLAEGSYPQLQLIELDDNVFNISSLVSILKKCPLLEDFDVSEVFLGNELDDLEDARTLAEVLHEKKRLIIRGLSMTISGARHLFTCTDWPKLESLKVTYYHSVLDYGDRVVAGLVHCECPCLKELVLYNLIITPEGYRLFSSTEWPELEILKLDVGDSSLWLEPINLPKLKSLTLWIRLSTDAVDNVSRQYWPHLTELALFHCQEDGLSWDLGTVRSINNTCMPNLKVLEFWEIGLSDSDKVSIEEEAAATREYKIEWSSL